ncbi:MAG TPA: hypothetical protein VG298_01520 [Acidimicrobiales bacterium]|jgi:hypothetical protein|nr:hypothetical protein [Acidimicrobiales bacterium]
MSDGVDAGDGADVGDGAAVKEPRLAKYSAPDRRLLRGYGPAVVIAGGFLLMALLVPSIAPEANVSASTGGGGGASTKVGSPTGAPASGATTTVPAGTGAPGAAGGAAGGTLQNGGPSTKAATAPGTVTGCSGKQVAGDPYAPACVSFSGNNGGATSRGVTANQIVVSARLPAGGIQTADEAIQQIAGKYNSAQFSDTAADVERTTQDLVTYFNDKFQFYGRKIVLKFFNGQGSLVNEVTDAGQAQAQADAISASQQLGAFADVTALSQPYAEALSAQHVVNIGAPYMSSQWFASQAPYAWSFFPNCTDLGNESASIMVKQVVPQNVTYAGTGVNNGQPRRIAILAPDNPVYQQCVSQVTGALSAAGHPVVANLSYTLDLSQLSSEAGSIAQQIINDKITTLGCGCDPITLAYLTSDLDTSNYEPEIVNIGAAFTDEDLVAQLFDQSVWSHAAGITNNGNAPAYGSSLGYFAAKSVDPNNAPAHEVDLLYEDLYILALGIEQAGPNLSPTTFEHGLFNYAGGDGEYGPWSFNENGSGTFTPQHQYRYQWWNPNVVSAFDNEKGSWVDGTTWYSASTVPAGPAPVFPNGVQ